MTNIKLFLLFSHKLTNAQVDEANNKLGVSEIIYLPENLQKLWSRVSPEGELNLERLKKIADWIGENAEKKDYILVQGEYGSTYYLVNFSFQSGLIPIYSTSKRVYKEKQNEDGTIKREHIFAHINFRKYRKYYVDLSGKRGDS
jgi:hypothetical protein